MKASNVLLIRVNSTHELFHTRKAPDVLRAAFPGARLTTLATPQTETLNLLRHDSRFDEVIVFPPDVGHGDDKSPAALNRFLSGKKIDVTIACYGAMPEIDYQRHVLSLLLCPGRKLLMDKKGRLFPLASPRGLGILFKELGHAIWTVVARRGAALCHRMARRSLRPVMADLGALRDTGAIKRILWIRLDNIGDVIMSMPALRVLQANFPKAKVDVLIQSCSNPIFADLPGIGEVFTYNPPNMLRGAGAISSKSDWLSLVKRLRTKGYDLAVETRGNAVSRILAYASGARLRLGPARGPYENPALENFAGLMTHPIELTDSSQHAVENSLSVIKGAGLDLPKLPYFFGLSEGDSDTVTSTLEELGVGGPYAVVHGCTTDAMKQWPPSRFAAVADHLVKVHGLDVVLTGAGEDSVFNEHVREAASHPERIHNAAGHIALRDLPALYKNARILVTVDTGPTHIAAACGTPIVALCLPWIAATHYPFGQRDGVVTPFTGTVQEAPQTEFFKEWAGEFMRGIAVEDVTQAVDNKLKRGVDGQDLDLRHRLHEEAL